MLPNYKIHCSLVCYSQWPASVEFEFASFGDCGQHFYSWNMSPSLLCIESHDSVYFTGQSVQKFTEVYNLKIKIYIKEIFLYDLMKIDVT